MRGIKFLRLTRSRALSAASSTTSCSSARHSHMTYCRIGENDPRIFVIICEQHEVEICLKLVRWLFEGTNTLIMLDDCTSSKDVKGCTGKLVNLGFSAWHISISILVMTQQLSSITKPFWENLAGIVLFYTPSAKTTKVIFEAADCEAERGWKFSHLVFYLCHRMRLNFRIKKRKR